MQREFFRRRLMGWRDEIVRDAKGTIQNLQEDDGQAPEDFYCFGLVWGNVAKTVDGGGFQELFENFHTRGHLQVQLILNVKISAHQNFFVRMQGLNRRGTVGTTDT